MNGTMTTVAFVSYQFLGQDRRIGPMDWAAAESVAKEYARRHGMTDVAIEVWTCTGVKKVENPA